VAEGWWVYGVVAAGRGLPDGMPGVAQDAPELVESGDLAAVASRVPLDEFAGDALKDNLNDIEWLERVARSHEAVLDRTLAGGAVVPMRVCTIYRGRRQVREMLDDLAGTFGEALERLAGRAEWGVKAVADRARFERHARESSDAARALAAEVERKPEGAAYLARKKLAALVRDEADALIGDAVRDGHARLDDAAIASVLLPAQNRQLSGHEGEMVLNAAYLLDQTCMEPFGRVLLELEAEYGAAGLRFELTGPWPAYHFVAAEMEAVR
jgi:hypothetical protein